MTIDNMPDSTSSHFSFFLPFYIHIHFSEWPIFFCRLDFVFVPFWSLLPEKLFLSCTLLYHFFIIYSNYQRIFLRIFSSLIDVVIHNSYTSVNMGTINTETFTFISYIIILMVGNKSTCRWLYLLEFHTMKKKS